MEISLIRKPFNSGINLEVLSWPQSNAEGCVRTNDDATSAIKNLHATDPLTSITIGN